MKRWFINSLSFLLMALLVVSGCSSRTGTTATPAPANPAPPEKKDTASPAPAPATGTAKMKITVYSTVNDPPIQNVYKEIVEGFKKENAGVDVELQFPGSEYENILKVKMAANDMPDVFDTHGWAQIRYGKYLADLRDESWASQQTDTIKNVVTDKDGKVHALVMSEAKDGITYSEDILAKYNIEPPKTYDALIAAAEKIKNESKGDIVPFYFSGIDSWMFGSYLDIFATSLFISPKDNQADAFLNNTFDWNKWGDLAQKMLDLQKKGLINKDALTAKYSDLPKMFANGKLAFALGSPSFADEVHKITPNLKIGYMPVPSMVAGDEPNFSGGERYTMGAWKDSKHLPEAKKLIAYFAKKESMEKIANATKLPPGLKGISSNHEFSDYYKKYESIRVFPYFDRVYLPNGMWDVMCKQGTELIAGRITTQQFSQIMKQEVERLRKK
ncbi:ABC transporter substrate-binding protein [Paenibacillus radicis (ex Xue et al. 2023)]|uniref:Extracellular solute-binding protein n=1 Tax=Paenibacillus radicis (ex Xue et al. 2023) TaxID=2972489 RepID=A0ABT1YBE1_9BACL|nr:extracellular solute-binding protein [Paenibacillus radicis (ex Xue et al. 2023)]MCR8630506.1 extracellular solute-binding protein [Paenibacillus radicis (ex Xue et al. 2023)]